MTKKKKMDDGKRNPSFHLHQPDTNYNNSSSSNRIKSHSAKPYNISTYKAVHSLKKTALNKHGGVEPTKLRKKPLTSINTVNLSDVGGYGVYTGEHG